MTTKVGFNPLSAQVIQRKLRDALIAYRQTAFRKPDAVKIGEVQLPVVVVGNREVDLNEKFKDAVVVGTEIGRVPFLPYVKDFGDGQGEKLMIHFFPPTKPAVIIFDPDDPTKVFLGFTKKIKMGPLGLED